MDIIEFDLKKNMFFSVIPKIREVLKSEKDKNYNEFYNHIFDTSFIILNIVEAIGKITYEQAFILVIAMAPYFESIKNTVDQEELVDENKWLTKQVSAKTGTYFSHIFLNEAYPEINKETYKYNNKTQKEFFLFVKKIIEKT